MIHPDTELVEASAMAGFGVFATKDIPKGTLTWCMDPLDIVLTRKDARSLPQEIQHTFFKLSYQNSQGDYVLNWDIGRYQNHSCSPTSCLLPGLQCEIAVRDVSAGEQLSSDYATYNLETGWPCKCGAPNCRIELRPGEKALRMKELQPLISNALRHFDNVSQPLLPFFKKISSAKDLESVAEPRRDIFTKIKSAIWALRHRG